MTRLLNKQSTRTLIMLFVILMLPAIALAGKGTEVGLNKSIIIDLKNPVQRCESADSDIAGCVMILSTKLQITGVAPGTSTLTLLDEKGGKKQYSILVRDLKKIPLRKGMTIDLHKPITRWNATNPSVIKCVKISPNRLQITGVAVGESTLTIWGQKNVKQGYDISIKGDAEWARTQGKMTKLPPLAQQSEPAGSRLPGRRSEPSDQNRLRRPEPAAAVIIGRDVSLHNSLKIDLKKPMQRCESADRTVAECVRITPTKLQINGTSMGNTSITVWDEGGGKQLYNIHVKGHKEVVVPRSIIDLPKPVQRCEPIDPAILECVRISPTQLQINGVTLGNTTLAVWEEGGGKQIYDIQVKGVEIPLNKIEVVKVEFPSPDPHQGENSLLIGANSGKDRAGGDTPFHITPIMADKNIANFVKSTEMPVSSLMGNGHYQANLLIRGVKIGETSLILMEGDGRSRSYNIRVKPDLTRLEQQIREVAPNDQISVEYANDYLILAGKATNDRTVARVVLLAKAYATKSESTTTNSIEGGSGGDNSGGSNSNKTKLEAYSKLSSNMHRSKIDSMNIDRLVQMSQEGQETSYKILNLIQIDNPQQVMLEVKVAQVNKSAMKELGVSSFIKGASGEGFSNMIGVPTGAGISGTGAALGSISNLDPYQLGFSLFKPGIGAVLKALVTKNQAKILAEPNLLVKSGQEGHFLAGQRIPLSTITSVNGISTPSIEYQPVGVSLIFKPEVMENGLISLTIDPAEVSNVSGYMQTNGYPIIDTREVRTSVQLKDGESLVLAGLLHEETIKVLSKIPLAGDIPILGALFRSTSEDIKEKELVFFITPRLVKPTAQGVKIPLPTDRPLTAEQKEDMRWIPRK